MTLPKGWQLTTLQTYNEVGTIAESGFELGPPEAATITYKYTSTAVAQPHGFNFPNIGNDTYACAMYSMAIKAIGPVGIPIE